MATSPISSTSALRAALLQHEAFRSENAIFNRSSPEYHDATRVWGAQRNLKPELVVKPTSVSQITSLCRLLYESTLDFAICNGHVGSTSARDVVVSLALLNSISFDKDSESVTVGAGAIWKDVDSYMEQHANGWAIVGARTPFVGVTGSVVIGGISWLSHEYGLISDPGNLLDARVALGDGRLIWASEEPDLLWAIRGGRCPFGIITELKFRARYLGPEQIYFARVSYPMSKLEEISRAVAKQIATNKDPKMAFHAFIYHPQSIFFPSEPGVGLMLFDRHGTAHARGSDGFAELLGIGDCKEMAEPMTLYDVNDQTNFAIALMGSECSFDATGLVDEVDEHFLVRMKDWFYKVLESDPAFATGSYCLFEVCQASTFGSTKPQETGWPHGKAKHVLQLGVGYKPEKMHLKTLALQQLAEAFQTIPTIPLGSGDFTPTFFEPTMMTKEEMYKGNLKKLEKVADRYDPKRRFPSLFNPSPNF